MPKKNKQSQGGRPSKKGVEKFVYEDEGRYIATNECAFKLLQLITEMANYKIITVTGPIGDRNKPALIKSRKKIEKEQEAIRKTIDMEEQYIFFLRDPEKNPRKYTIREGRLEEEEDYAVDLSKMERLNQLSLEFQDSLKLLLKELNPTMQTILQEFIFLFLASDKTKDQFQKDCLEEIEKNPEKYKEIIQWDKLYETAYDEKVKLLELDLDLFKTKYDVKASNATKLSEVDKKRIIVVEREQKVISQYKEQQKDHRPLTLFLSRLFQIVHQHYQ